MIVKILGHEYEVSFDKKDTEGRGEFGNCWVSKLKISIDPESPKSWQNETIIHEIVEALNAQLELKLKHPQINRAASIIHQIAQDNPTLLAFLANAIQIDGDKLIKKKKRKK